MAKLEDISALLTEEIADFKKVTKEIKEVIKSVDNSGLRNEVSYLKGYIESHYNTLLVVNNNNNQSTKAMIDKITQSLSYPKWIIKVSIFLMIFVLSIVAFSFYRISQITELEIRAYEQGKSEMRSHYSNFVKDNSEVEKIYQVWIKNQNTK